MHSPWFQDAVPGSTAMQAAAHFQLDGSWVLPSISIKTPTDELKAMLSTISTKLGDSGRKAMKKYLADMGLPAGCEASRQLVEAFGEEVASSTTKMSAKVTKHGGGRG